MIATVASSLEAAAAACPDEPHGAWRRAWQRLRADQRAGEHIEPRELANYLADVPEEDQKDCVCDLIAEHLRLYSRAGEPCLEDYAAALCGEYPWLKEFASLPADLIEEEFLARSTPPEGDYPRLANYRFRFPGRPEVDERLARRSLAGERYIKLRPLGAGAMGVVFEAYDSQADRLVAVKEASLADPPAAERLIGETELLRRLNHPGVVAIQDAGESPECVFCVMELVAGASLASLIAEYHIGRPYRPKGENRRQLRLLVSYIAQMCDAISHSHFRGILHRDLKPGNVLLRQSGEAVIVDWGLARKMEPPGRAALDSHSRFGVDEAAAIAGTPQYMAPEQARRQETAASDIFALGATLYEVLTGRPPYDWKADCLPANWLEAVVAAKIAPPRRLVSNTPRPLDAICTKALERDPSDRYPSASALAAELRRFLDCEQQQATGWLARLGLSFS